MQNAMYNALKPEEGREQVSSPQAARVMGIKRIIQLWKGIDMEGRGTATWDEFLDLFRRTGLLLTYTTPNNPRDRLAGDLANEYQQRQSMAQCRKTTMGLTSKHIIDQKQQELSTQWATERRLQSQEQSSALPVVQDSIGTLKQAAQARAISPTSPRTRKSQTSKHKASEPESATKEDDANSAALQVELSSPPVKLPSIWQPITPRGRSHSSLFERRPCSESKSPKKSPRRSLESRRSTPPSKRGRAPRQVPQVLCVN